jgi:hypothetical protein
MTEYLFLVRKGLFSVQCSLTNFQPFHDTFVLPVRFPFVAVCMYFKTQLNNNFNKPVMYIVGSVYIAVVYKITCGYI